MSLIACALAYGAVRIGCEKSAVNSVLKKVDDGSFFTDRKDEFRDDPRAQWRSVKNREAALAGFSATALVSVRYSVADAHVIEVRESDDGETSVAEIEFKGTIEGVPVHGFGRTFFNQKGVTVLIAFFGPVGSDDSGFNADLAKIDRKVREHPGERADSFVQLPAWKPVPLDSSSPSIRQLTDRGSVVLMTEGENDFAMIAVDAMTPSQAAEVLVQQAQKPEMKKAMSEEINKQAGAQGR